MTDDETIEFERLKTARDGLLLTVANLRRRLETIAAEEREACAKVCDVLAVHPEYASEITKLAAQAIRNRGQV